MVEIHKEWPGQGLRVPKVRPCSGRGCSAPPRGLVVAVPEKRVSPVTGVIAESPIPIPRLLDELPQSLREPGNTRIGVPILIIRAHRASRVRSCACQVLFLPRTRVGVPIRYGERAHEICLHRAQEPPAGKIPGSPVLRLPDPPAA